jgi:hypothetical protein
MTARITIMATHGRERAVAWARSSEDDVTRICAIALIFENVALALNLMRNLDEAQRSGNDNRIRKVRGRLDRVLAGIAWRSARSGRT